MDYSRIFWLRRGVVNSDTSNSQRTCDGSIEQSTAKGFGKASKLAAGYCHLRPDTPLIYYDFVPP
jgi:hypothetical protein